MTTAKQKQPLSEQDSTHQTQQALAVLAEERERLAVERAAFSRFHKRITDSDAHKPTAPQKTTTESVLRKTSDTTPSSSQLTQIRTAYRETVMDVPHYQEDYDQPLDEHLAEEFSPELANALVTADSLTPPLRNALLVGCQQAIDSRQTLLSALGQEADSLKQARETLEKINTALEEVNQQPMTAWSTQELTTNYEQLSKFETRCDELAAERQSRLHSQRVHGPKHANEEFNEYLYESLAVTYPVLADIAEFESLLRTAQRRLEHALIGL